MANPPVDVQPEPAAAPRRRDPEDKRERILNAAMGLLASDGYEAMTTARVAAEAGVSEGILFHHFGTKHGVLAALAERFACHAFEATFAAERQGRVAPGTDEMLRPLFEYARDNRALVRAFASLSQPSDYALASTAVRRQMISALERLLIHQEDLGRVRPMEPEIVAELLFAMVSSALQRCFVEEDGRNTEAWLRETCACIDAAVRPV